LELSPKKSTQDDFQALFSQKNRLANYDFMFPGEVSGNKKA
jgi:hypothetical protein